MTSKLWSNIQLAMHPTPSLLSLFCVGRAVHCFGALCRPCSVQKGILRTRSMDQISLDSVQLQQNVVETKPNLLEPLPCLSSRPEKATAPARQRITRSMERLPSAPLAILILFEQKMRGILQIHWYKAKQRVV